MLNQFETMFTKHEKSQFTRLLTNIKRIKADILFLKDCKLHKVIPNFINVRCSVHNSRTEKVIRHAENTWLSSEIQYHYSCLDKKELNLYSLHLKMTRSLDDIQVHEFNRFHFASISRSDTVFNKKRKTQNEKLNKLLASQPTKTPKPSVKPVPDLIVNISNDNFDTEELDLLNRGLNFTVKPNKDPIMDIIVDIESSIQYKQFDVKKKIRDVALPLIKKTRQNKHNDKNSQLDTLNKLKQHDVFYMKSDKGNKVVIMDKQQYDERIYTSIQEENFTISKTSPLNAMKKDAKRAIDAICRVFDVNKFRLLVPNPSVPLMYGLPKVHKNGNKMRKIVSNINSPLSNVARWLVKDLNKTDVDKILGIINNTVQR